MKALRNDLAHVTIAADPMKFWPLATELKGLGVEVTFVRESVPEQEDVANFLQTIEVQIVDPSGRKFGYITSLKSSSGSKVDFGFITLEEKIGADEKNTEGIFFSFNHMRKKGNEAEIEIDELVLGDYVSFALGMNNKGVCATDVTLIKRADGAPQITMATTSVNPSRRNVSEEMVLLDTIKEAVIDCANTEGWALLSAVGNRANILLPNFKERYKAAGYAKIATLVEHSEIFDSSAGGPETGLSAACIRLRKR